MIPLVPYDMSSDSSESESDDLHDSTVVKKVELKTVPVCPVVHIVTSRI